MGYVRHDAVIVTMSAYVLRGEALAPAPDIDGFRKTLPEDWRHLLIGPVESIINDDVTFVFAPDGSKEGWTDSDMGDDFREQFKKLFAFAHKDGSSPFSVAHVRFGGDEPGARYEPELIVENGRGVRIDSGQPGWEDD